MSNETNQLVITENGEARTTSLLIAEGLEVEHASIIKLVRTYQSDLEEFGRVGFEIEPFETAGGTQTREVAKLNEQQSTLIMTYAKNTEIARMFKKRLVKAFYEYRTIATNQVVPSTIQNPATRAMIMMLTNYDALEYRMTMVESKNMTRDESYFTVAGYCNIKGIKLDRAAMAMVGKMASQYSRTNNIKTGQIYDSRYGKVNEYHVEALQYALTPDNCDCREAA